MSSYTFSRRSVLAFSASACFLTTNLSAYAQDCNLNGVNDACDIACGAPGGACDVAGCGGSRDCNANGVPDECDLASGTSFDCQGNGILDDCEQPSVRGLGSRYVAITPLGPDLDPTERYALEVWPICLGCDPGFAEASGVIGPLPVYRLPSEWCTIMVRDGAGTSGPGFAWPGQFLVPSSASRLSCVAVAALPENPAVPFVVLNPDNGAIMPIWGDVAGPWDGAKWSPPDGNVDVLDIVAFLEAFAARPGAPALPVADIAPPLAAGDCLPADSKIDVLDLVAVLSAFQGDSFPCAEPCYSGPP